MFEKFKGDAFMIGGARRFLSFLADGSTKAVAWDRDVELDDYELHPVARYYPRGLAIGDAGDAGNTPTATIIAGEGSSFYWEEDSKDPLGGRWARSPEDQIRRQRITASSSNGQEVRLPPLF